MKKYLICFAIATMSLANLYCQDTEKTAVKPVQIEVSKEYKETAIKLFSALDLTKDYDQLLESVIRRASNYGLDIPAEFWDKLKAQYNDTEFVDDQIQIYAKVFSLDEMKEMLKFYDSPLFKKINTYNNSLFEQLDTVREMHYLKIIKSMGENIEKKGYEVPEFMKPKVNNDTESIENSDENK